MIKRLRDHLTEISGRARDSAGKPHRSGGQHGSDRPGNATAATGGGDPPGGVALIRVQAIEGGSNHIVEAEHDLRLYPRNSIGDEPRQQALLVHDTALTIE